MKRARLSTPPVRSTRGGVCSSRRLAALVGSTSLGWLAATFAPAPDASAGEPPAAAAEGAVVAWYVVTPDTKEAQEYKGTPYVWLGRTALRLEVDVEPREGLELELSWGAKGDEREAILTIDGAQTRVRRGGHDGFRPVRVPLPPKAAAKGYTVVLAMGPEPAAFLSAFRVIDVRAAAGGAPAGGPTAHRMRLEAIPRPRPEAFPEMRKIWDREPAAPRRPLADARTEAAFRQAERNGRLASEQIWRCRKLVEGWLANADPETGLIPRNLGADRDIWNAQDAAADNYPFMVLTAAIADRPLFEGRMLDMLRAETRLTSRVDRLPDTYSFSKRGFRADAPNLDAVIFGAAEYVKDGLLPLTEWLGPSPWSQRMVGILDDIWKHAPVSTSRGAIPTTNVEVNGDLLQALSRNYWLTGEAKYLDWAVRLGDHYLLDEHPTRKFTSLRLRDHGCEIVSGLSELYAALSFARPEKKAEYEEPVHAMFDRILEVGRDERGMLYDSIDPLTGEHSKGICDTWGYNYNGIYTVYLIDRTDAYREAVRHVLAHLPELASYHWGSADEYADSIEGAINLYNREPVAAAAAWIDGEIQDMWSVQRPDGVIEGWHGDGNSARTAIMYTLWKSQGLTVRPWRDDVRVGAVRDGDAIHVSLLADRPWEGTVLFDRPRHRLQMRLPIDYPRINQFPEWFVAEPGKRYSIETRSVDGSPTRTATGEDLAAGWPVALEPEVELRLTIRS